MKRIATVFALLLLIPVAVQAQAPESECTKWFKRSYTLLQAKGRCIGFWGVSFSSVDPVAQRINEWLYVNRCYSSALGSVQTGNLQGEVIRNMDHQQKQAGDFRQFCAMMWNYRRDVLEKSSVLVKPAPKFRE
jgi:hypothetical protein